MSRPSKPAGLIDRHETIAEKVERVDRQELTRPEYALPQNPPASIQGNKVAAATWRKLMRIYGSMQAEIVSGVDYLLVERFCAGVGELAELRELRQAAHQQAAAGSDAEAIDTFVKLDARVDRKSALLHTLSQSLYLTPRARAGVHPKPKEAEKPTDQMDQLLEEITEYMNQDV